MDWHDTLKKPSRPRPTRVSRNGQIVLSAQSRWATGIEPGDLVVVVPLATGTLVIEKVAGAGRALRSQHERPDNPLRGVWGADPDYWLEELRSRWRGSDGVS